MGLFTYGAAALTAVASMTAGLLPATAALAKQPAGSAVADAGITGTWVSTTGPERLVFAAGGNVRSCFAPGKAGNAAMGRWKTVSPGRYLVEFTHVANADCQAEARPIRKHPASIRGTVLISQGELALFVSGEFPPDLYRPLHTAPMR